MATKPDIRKPGAPSAMRVTILHNYRDAQQPSMRLYAERLGQALARRQVAVTRIRPPEVMPAAWRTRSAGWNKVDAYLGRFAVYPRLLRNIDADVAHIVDHAQGYLVAGLDPRHTVVTCHDLILLVLAAGRIGGLRVVPQLALNMFKMSVEFMKGAAKVVADSTQTKRDLVDFTHIDPDKVTVIHPGLNQAFAPEPAKRPAWRRRFGFDEKRVILQVGKDSYKNLPGVIRVLHRLRRDGVDAYVARVGAPLAGSNRALAERLGMGPYVMELGAMRDRDLCALYNAVDVLLFPSLYEGFGWPPLEAMASGTPVVCSRAGSLDEVIGDAALTADPEDVDALAWHVGSVLTDDSLRAALVERGLAHAATFDWDKTAEQMIGLYRTILARA